MGVFISCSYYLGASHKRRGVLGSVIVAGLFVVRSVSAARYSVIYHSTLVVQGVVGTGTQDGCASLDFTYSSQVLPTDSSPVIQSPQIHHSRRCFGERATSGLQSVAAHRAT